MFTLLVARELETLLALVTELQAHPTLVASNKCVDRVTCLEQLPALSIPNICSQSTKSAHCLKTDADAVGSHLWLPAHMRFIQAQYCPC